MRKHLQIVFLVSLSVLGCTKKSSLSSGRWDGGGKEPPLPFFEKGTSESSSIHGDLIQIQHQKVGDYPVEGAYLKTISGSNQQSRFHRFNLLRVPKKSLIKEALELEGKKFEAWLALVKRNPEYLKYSVEKPVEIVISPNPKPHVVFAVNLLFPSHEVYRIQFHETGDIARYDLQSSSFDTYVKNELAQSKALAFPKGPKKSSLSDVVVPRFLNLDNLINQSLEVFTQGSQKIIRQQSLEIQPTEDKFDQVQAFYFGNQFLAWLKTKELSPEEFKVKIQTDVGFPEATNAAFYYDGEVRLGKGDDKSFSKIPWDPSIVAHEIGHGLIQKLSQLPYQGEGGSLNEGFADFFTTFYLGSPYLGEAAYKLSPFKRAVNIVRKFNQRTGGLYHDSLVVSGFFWSLRDLIPEDQILKLGLGTLIRLGPSSDFDDFRISLKESSKEILTEEELEKVERQWRDFDL